MKRPIVKFDVLAGITCVIIGLFFFGLLGRLIYVESWKKGFREGWCNAQPAHVRC